MLFSRAMRHLAVLACFLASGCPGRAPPTPGRPAPAPDELTWSRLLAPAPPAAEPAGFPLPRHAALALDPAGNQLLLAPGSGRSLSLTLAAADGAPSWSQAILAEDCGPALDVAFDSEGEVLAAVCLRGAARLGTKGLGIPGTWALAVSRLDAADGHSLWLRTFDISSACDALRLAVDRAGQTMLLCAARSSRPASSPRGEILTSLLLAGGQVAWTQRAAFEGALMPASLLPLAGGDSILAGTFQGCLRLPAVAPLTSGAPAGFVARLDPAGAARWARQLGGRGEMAVLAAQSGPEGRIAMAGTCAGQFRFAGRDHHSPKGGGAWLGWIDEAGHELALRELPAGLTPTCLGTEEARLLLGGRVSAPVELDGQRLAPDGDWSLFAARLSAEDRLEWWQRFGRGERDASLGAGMTHLIPTGDGDILALARFTGVLHLERYRVTARSQPVLAWMILRPPSL
ncbi:MAG: hypothetical protein JXR96_01200 [Deltaproteobacteria bacterium]|nr:hypothetical protein [Deltaproteobacteria bacterium]